jgi:beta-glucuronidase
MMVTILFLSCNEARKKEAGTQLRVEKSFNEDWYFVIDSLNQGEKMEWFSPDKIPSDTLLISIPHTWNVMHGLESYNGSGWYFKFFTVPESWAGKRIRMQFNAIYRDATLWINGNLLLKRTGSGYTPFEIDLSDHLSFDRQNLIAIKVSNEFSADAIPYENKFDWSADGGITRGVSLIKTENPYISFLHVEPTLKYGSKGDLKIKLGIAGNGKPNTGTLDVWWQIREYNQPANQIMKEGNQKVKIIDSELILNLEVDDIKPWHFNVPTLYLLRVAVGDQMVLRDHAETTFGFRSLITRGEKILFNGETVRLPGIEWMPGSDPDQGMGEDSLGMVNMLSLLKNTNSILTRFHWQQDDFILKWCDENGILVQEEIPLWQAPYPDQLNHEIRNLAEQQLKEMIRVHYNHPSIVAWGIGNELSAQDQAIKDFLNELKSKILELDSSRLINYVSNTFHQNPEMDGTTLGDVLMWNDYSGLWYNMDGHGLSSEMLQETLSNFKKLVPGKPLIISEYGLCEPVFKGGDPRRIEHFLYNTDIYDQHDWIAGVIYFSLNDYRTHMGEEGKGRFRQRVHGIVDLYGNKKPSYSVVKERFSPVKQLEGDVINNNFHVTGKNHDGLPSYTLYNYKVRIYGENEELIAEELIPNLQPGQGFNVVFRGVNGTVKMIRIMTANDFLVASKQL